MGKIKENPRYDVVSFRTTEERKARLLEAKGSASLSEFIDLLLSLYIQGPNNDNYTAGPVSA